MKKYLFLVAFAAVASLTACTENLSDSTNAGAGLTFQPSVVTAADWSGTRALPTADVMRLTADGEQPLYLHTVVEPRVAGNTTRGQLVEGDEFPTNQPFGVSGYRYSTASPLSSTAPNFFYNAKVTYNAAKWQADAEYYIPTATEQLAFYAYYPYDATAGSLSGSTDAAPLTISYTVNTTDITAQQDLMTATVSGLTYNPSQAYRVPLQFEHALTAVRFELSDDVAIGRIKKVGFCDIGLSGTLTVGAGWNLSTTGNLLVDFTGGSTTGGYDTSTLSGNTALLSGEKTLLMIPQAFSGEQPCIYLELNDGTKDHALYYYLDGTRWLAGTQVTYRLSTTSINSMSVAAVTYPAKWGTEAFSFKTDYATGEAIGVFVVGDDGTVLNANARYNKTTSGWTPDATDNLPYKSTYKYYAYYPYKAEPAGAPAVGDKFTGTEADAFFANMIDQWPVSADQSTKEKLLANDLHICRGTAGSRRMSINFTMSHQLGLAGISFEGKSVTGAVRFYAATDVNDTGSYSEVTGQTIWIYATTDIKNYDVCYSGSSTLHYYVVKGDRDYTFESVDGEYNSWAAPLTVNVPAGTVVNTYQARLKSGIATSGYVFKGKYFNCVSDVQTYATPKPGSYKLEVYGGQGGSGTINSRTAAGGKGGYAYGNTFFYRAENLYVCVGAKGTNMTSKTNMDGAYNGGAIGMCWQSGSYYAYWCPGGGATHIARQTDRGELRYYVNNKTEVAIVAGGGGGAGIDTYPHVNAGGTGGGTTGGTGNGDLPGTGGSQTQGGRGRNSTSDPYTYGAFGYALVKGGGGGWYAGGYGNWNASSAGGGSGYTGGVLNGSMTNGAWTGAGYARITTPIKVN